MVKIGLDTSCLNVKGKHNILNKLENLGKKSKILLITSTVNEKGQEISNKNDFYKSKYLEKINQKEKIFEVGRYGISRFGKAVFGDDNKCNELDKLFPDKKDFYDLWLLQTACTGKCDYFLTLNSRDFIDNVKKEKIENLAIKIRLPNEEFLDELNEIISKS